MIRSTVKRLAVALTTLGMAVAIHLALPETPRAAESGCGPNSGNICWENESCFGIIWYRQCTTTYKYYPAASEEESDGGEKDAPTG